MNEAQQRNAMRNLAQQQVNARNAPPQNFAMAAPAAGPEPVAGQQNWRTSMSSAATATLGADLTNPASAALLVQAHGLALPPMSAGFDSGSSTRPHMSDAASAFAGRIENYLVDATDLTNELAREASAVAQASQTLESAVAAVTASLDGSDGAIAKQQAQLETLRGTIDVDINNIAMSGKGIATGIKDLVTGVLTSFTRKAGDKKTDDGSGGREQGEGGTTTLQSIDTVSDGFSKMTEAQEKPKRDSAALAAGYQQLAQLNTLLAAAVMRTQSSITAGAEEFSTEVHDDAATAALYVRALQSNLQSLVQLAQ